jgi:hypothetical protein
MKKEHPLLANERWGFNQPDLGFTASYTAVPKGGGKSKTHSITTSNTCREGIITNTRSYLQNHLTNKKECVNNSWAKSPGLAVTHDIDLTKEEKKATELRIQWHSGYMQDWPTPASVEEFIRVCDVVMGPVCVLLGPWRPKGDWWKTDPSTQPQVVSGGAQYVHWRGSDNWFLAHPATVGIATALYRQCYHLCGTGLGPKIIKTLKPSEVEEVMSNNSQRLALQLVKRTRPYIEVPIGKGASRVNYAFTLGLWRRLIRLQRAVRRHDGYERALGQDFAEGWFLANKGYAWNGLWRFWGDEEELTDHHRHLMKMGAPRRAASGGKPAPKNS